ncbi:C-type lectin domain family 2 member D-like [Carettochelys insculpta]|uniref:C-type lectin domain family 2 member D-like n=1 Tax=Carettochelys insculpta TaxID=44489 RepID=UPI003EBA918F
MICGVIITVIVLPMFVTRTSSSDQRFSAGPGPDPTVSLSSGPPFCFCPGSHIVPYCPDEWVGYRGKCYYFSEEEKDWDSSQHFCSSFNASLATIDTRKEQEFIRRYAGLVEHWIGLRREPGQPWTWVNGTPISQKLHDQSRGRCERTEERLCLRATSEVCS